MAKSCEKENALPDERWYCNEWFLSRKERYEISKDWYIDAG
jgi:hypothetical protein